MQPLDLNLASRPFRNNTLLWVGLVAIVGLLGWFTTWNVNAFRANSTQLAELRDKVARYDRQMDEYTVRAERADLEIARYDLKNLARQAAKANDVIEWKAFSWTRLFNLLEQLQPYKVRMESVRPVFYAAERRQTRQTRPRGSIPVRVQGIAENIQTFLELERSLLLDPHFDAVEPQGSTRLESGEVKFELRFLYFPGRRSEDLLDIPDLPPVIELGTPAEFAKHEGEDEAPAETSVPAGDAGGTSAGGSH